jgi:Thoeris protein ThsB, TIR-like domain
MSIFWPPKGRPSLPWLDQNPFDPPRLPNAPQPGQNPFDFLPLPPSIPLAPPLARSPAPTAIPEVKRKVYFAFTFSDILRVNNVRQIGKIVPRESRNARTFFDRSIWERRSIKNDEGLKTLMRNGVKYSSAVCVLIGTDTWDSRWVKHEISRALVDGRGLFSVHINSLDHNVRRAPDPWGHNPLHLMGVYKDDSGRFNIWEKRVVIKNVETGELGWEWQPYEDYTDPVSLPRYITDIAPRHIMPLSWVTSQYDFIVDGGAKNLGSWIDAAALSAGK